VATPGVRDDITLYGARESGHAFKARVLLEMAQLPYTFHEVDLKQARDARSPAFRTLSPYGEVPVLLHNGRTYAQSNAVLLHLAAHSGVLEGETVALQEGVRQWLFWEANRIGFSLPNLRYALRVGGADPAVVTMLRARFHDDISRMDIELADGRDFILGDAPTIADISMSAYLFWADQAQVAVPMHVAGWLQRISKLPGWRHPYSFYA
jgi:glutathione S-transferase